ncbi:protein-tyrosine phosphatase family protein [Burkholderia gladioli]|uniref:protein-tyrosine phosphatase family protein n=1 Tax=Burkholderia gladioli TaxID=28095 RepID=UPI0013DDC001|nr:dual specificity protein phosphatase family protein [Burkholderia gladioli]MBJ9661198.1 dual specificity protein phosphatase family protein [Burkholderia gladioli]MBJ9713153.1 dual specificity protein phosphatase family protein [Burkholderia gladioli]MBU9155049.1 dual specificity protein phosphatase family protein [Burkholderia gladioli]MBU9165928.1 dual specificity protein phosphatase family protein [Burkholderia gladioli]MBU9195733.1 dual specificity protein phosphatase family protein [Bu
MGHRLAPRGAILIFTQIDDRLWIGPQPAEADVLAHRIGATVSLRRATPDPIAGIEQFHRPLSYWHEDFKRVDLDTLSALVDGLRARGLNVLVHCREGVDRSGVFAIAHLRSQLPTLDSALDRYRAIRASTPLPRFGGIELLRGWFN